MQRRRAWPLAGVASLALALPMSAGGQEGPDLVGLRVGNHPTFGRVVLDWPRTVEYRAERTGDRLVLRFDGVAAEAVFDMTAAHRMPRNVAAIDAGGEGVAIVLRPGVRVRHFRLGTRVVVDAHDAEGSAPAAPVPATANASAAPAATAPPSTGTATV